MDVKVSVIIPVYNVEKYLKQCVESVINQTLRDIEIICVDDGSTDDSLKILKQFEAIDSRVRVFSKANGGYGHTINYGLAKSQGKYIMIVESDDYIDEEGTEKLYNCAELWKADYVRSNYYEFEQGKNRVNDSLQAFPYNKILSVFEEPALFYSISISPWACLYKKEFLEKNQIRVNETPGASFQDNSWQFIVLLRAERMVFIEDAYYHYRMDNMDSSINSSKKIFCVADEVKYIKQKMKKYKVCNSVIWEALSRFTYEIYKWNYSRVSAEFQYAFLLEWKREIIRQKDKGHLVPGCFEKEQWDELNQILNEVDSYFEYTAKEYVMKGVYEKTINVEMYQDAFLDKLLSNKLIIFGTGTVAQEIVKFLQIREKMDNIVYFCETVPKQKSFLQKPILSIKDLPLARELLVICAVAEKVQKDIVKNLKNMGYTNVLSVDGNLRQKIQQSILE